MTNLSRYVNGYEHISFQEVAKGEKSIISQAEKRKLETGLNELKTFLYFLFSAVQHFHTHTHTRAYTDQDARWCQCICQHAVVLVFPVYYSLLYLLSVHLASVLFLLFVVPHWYRIDSVLTYDRQALLNIKSCMVAHLGFCPAPHSHCQSSSCQPASECARWLPCCVPPLRKEPQEERESWWCLGENQYLHLIEFVYYKLGGTQLDGRDCSWDYRYVFHLTIFPDFLHSSNCSVPEQLRIRHRGMDCLNLCQLECVQPDLASLPQSPLNMTLVNARSVCNKTFILYDFYSMSYSMGAAVGHQEPSLNKGLRDCI
ncbi:uncharacterized protein LOC128607439 [Ictalurus furcatus]|uniref:uncharacterized protein LOC128607439 n=1 Tax=Ictalurus furcatus TaxID=66913 RepID=UPI002350288E|nr:uncharacterized protein LOC128607439 [Ictalurus furcatus]